MGMYITLPDAVKGCTVGIVGSGVSMISNAAQHVNVNVGFGQIPEFFTGDIDGVRVVAVPRHGTGPQPIAPHQIPYEAYMPLFAETTYLIGLSRVGDYTGAQKTGDIVIPEDFITWQPKTLHLPGAEFANCNGLVDNGYRSIVAKALEIVGRDNIPRVYHYGIYNTHPGPQFETPAEANFYHDCCKATLGGMTSGYEAKLAAELREYNRARGREASPKYACLCTVVNPASNHTNQVSHEITEREMKKAKPVLEKLVRALVRDLGRGTP